MNQNENKPLTADEMIESKYLLQRLCQNTKWRLRDAMEEYAAQQAKTAEENATWAHDQLQSTQEELIYYKDRCKKQGEQVKQVTEERDKLQYSNEILAKAYHRLTSERDTAVELLQQLLNGEIGSFMYPSEKRQITGFLNSLNAAKEGGE